uniref:F-box/LRR-repeat protein n=1 Tax=Angiostrongylus cantonensis TaxID=6313 RepID=A0A0K0CVX0_ANGCA
MEILLVIFKYCATLEELPHSFDETLIDNLIDKFYTLCFTLWMIKEISSNVGLSVRDICIHLPPTMLNEVECMGHLSGIDQLRALSLLSFVIHQTFDGVSHM